MGIKECKGFKYERGSRRNRAQSGYEGREMEVKIGVRRGGEGRETVKKV